MLQESVVLRSGTVRGDALPTFSGRRFGGGGQKQIDAQIDRCAESMHQIQVRVHVCLTIKSTQDTAIFKTCGSFHFIQYNGSNFSKRMVLHQSTPIFQPSGIYGCRIQISCQFLTLMPTTLRNCAMSSHAMISVDINEEVGNLLSQATQQLNYSVKCK